ncbi:MAG TPA: flagellar brake protein [Methylophilaceae bacterium]|nr:flagellar brake protein [Methylophilaceae bacterium]
MSTTEQVKRLPKDIIKIGIPIGYPVFDSGGQLLMQAGVVIESEGQLEKLYERGLYVDQKTSEMLHLKPGGKKSFVSDAIKKEDSQPEGEIVTELPFKSLKLGETLQISPTSDETGSTKYFVKFIGGIDKKSLICTLPTIDDKVAFIKENTGYSVRMFSGKHVFRFNTMVDAVLNRPYPHMHLKFPREVYSNRLRKNQRVNVNIIISMTSLDQPSGETGKSAGRIIDMSLGGAMIEAYKTAGKVGESLECSFKINMEGGEALFVIPAILRSIVETKQADGRMLYKQGIQFKEIRFQDKIVLQSYIFQALTGEKLDEL